MSAETWVGYEPWVGKLDDGTEVLVTLQTTQEIIPEDEWEFGTPMTRETKTVEVAFRGHWDRMWSPPVHLVRAP